MDDRSTKTSHEDNYLIWTPGETARRLGRSRSWIYSLIREGTIPHLTLPGGRIMFDPDAVRAWVKSLDTSPDESV